MKTARIRIAVNYPGQLITFQWYALGDAEPFKTLHVEWDKYPSLQVERLAQLANEDKTGHIKAERIGWVYTRYPQLYYKERRLT